MTYFSRLPKIKITEIEFEFGELFWKIYKHQCVYNIHMHTLEKNQMNQQRRIASEPQSGTPLSTPMNYNKMSKNVSKNKIK